MDGCARVSTGTQERQATTIVHLRKNPLLTRALTQKNVFEVRQRRKLPDRSEMPYFVIDYDFGAMRCFSARVKKTHAIRKA